MRDGTDVPGAIAVPPDLQQALAANPPARDAFQRLAPSHKREYVAWIEEARRPTTRARRVERTVAMLVTESS